MDIEVKVTWDQIGTHGADFKAQWQQTSTTEDSPVRAAIATLLETNTSVTLRDDSIGCTLIYRKVEHHEGIFPHECIKADCKVIVQYDDEPYCFTHSPESGSSFPVFSARSRANQLKER